MTHEPSDAPRRVRNIGELAKLAGVSAGTVSRALAGKSIVNEETRKRIQALAEAHQFRPNQMASRLRTQRTGVIGLVVPLGHERRQHLSDPFFMAILSHLADALTESGHDLMLSRVIPDADDWLERIVDSGMLDGVLIIGQSDQYATIERVARRYAPLVVWGSHLPDQTHCAIGTANVEGGRLAGQRLVASGARNIAFLGETRTPEILQRFEGLSAAVADAGLAAPLRLDAHLASDIMDQEVTAQVQRIVDDQIDGIAAASDLLAVTAVRILVARGIKVPRTVRVIGYDDLPLAQHSFPPLTTVRQDIATGAQAMVAALYRRMAGQSAGSLQMAPELIERGSG